VRVVVVGASWGGLRAVGDLLAGLPARFPAPVLVAQHRADDIRDDLLGDLLARRSALPVREAEDHGDLEPGRVVLAPPGYHLLVEGDHLELSVDEPVHFSRPSIDVLFESTAATRGGDAVGVVLTGANADGAAGLRAIAAGGGAALVQDPAEAERAEMPAAAAAAVPEARVLPLAAIAPALVELCG
jgi:two-component system chemotaxis response regulator CheB